MGGALPTNESLDTLFAEARSGRVVTVAGGGTLAEIAREDLRAIREMLRIVEGGQPFHCMCRGDLAIELRGRLLSVGSVSYHHGRSLRMESWGSDAMLADGPALLHWLAARGVPEPLADYEAAEEQGRRFASARERWMAAIPGALRDHAGALEQGGLPTANPAPFRAAIASLRAAHGDDEHVARVLIEWLAAGAGPWSGYASHEGIPMTLLDLLDGAAVVRAATDRALAGPTLGAAARYLGSHPVVSFKKRLLATVPDDFFVRARAQVAASGVADDLLRFDHAQRTSREARTRFANPAPYPIGGDCTVIGESADGPLSGLATDGGRLYSVDVKTIVRFEPGSIAPVAVHESSDDFVVLAASSERVAWLCINAGTVDAIDRATPGAVTPVARLRTRLLEIAAAGRTIAWIGDAPRGGRMLWARTGDDPQPRELAELGHDAWCLQLDATHAWLLSGAFAGNGTLLRVSLTTGSIDDVAPIAKIGASMASPVMCPWGDDVLVADGRFVMAIPKRGGKARAVLQASQRVTAVAGDEHGIVVLTSDDGGERWNVEGGAPAGGRAHVIGSFDRRPYHRHPLVLTRTAACFPCGDRILAAGRFAGDASLARV